MLQSQRNKETLLILNKLKQQGAPKAPSSMGQQSFPLLGEQEENMDQSDDIDSDDSGITVQPAPSPDFIEKSAEALPPRKKKPRYSLV